MFVTFEFFRHPYWTWKVFCIVGPTAFSKFISFYTLLCAEMSRSSQNSLVEALILTVVARGGENFGRGLYLDEVMGSQSLS